MMIKLLYLVFVFSFTAFYAVDAAAAPQAEDYSFDEGEEKTPEPVVEEVQPVQGGSTSERALPKLKTATPSRLMGAGTSALGSCCCFVCPPLGAGLGASAAYLISGASINIIRIAIVAGAVLGVLILMTGISLGVGLVLGTAGVVSDDPLDIISGGGNIAQLGINLVSIVAIPGSAAAAWFFTDGMGDGGIEKLGAQVSTPKPPEATPIAY